MWTAVYRRPCIAVQSLSFTSDTKDIIDACPQHKHQGYRLNLEHQHQKTLPVLLRSRHVIQPRRQYYDSLEADEFWTYAGKKSVRVRLVYACRRDSGGIAAWGKRE
jgi:hypothetical protein